MKRRPIICAAMAVAGVALIFAANADAGWSSWMTSSRSWQKQTSKLSKQITEESGRVALVRDACLVDDEEYRELSTDVASARKSLTAARKAWRRWKRGAGVEDQVDFHIDKVEDTLRLLDEQLDGYVVLEPDDLPCKPLAMAVVVEPEVSE